MVEHDEVVTLGRRSGEDDAAGVDPPIARGAGWRRIARARSTMAYPIRLLEEGRRDLHKYLRDLEQVVIDVLADSVSKPIGNPRTRVWVGARRSSLGVARRWVIRTGWRSTSTRGGPMPSPRSARAD
ncbi:MAG: hypothetical protein R3F17_02415 [Planctomycetota bacterium]